MSPAQNAATMKARLVTTISIMVVCPLWMIAQELETLRGTRVARTSRRSCRLKTSRLHVLHHRLGLLVVDDVGDREDDGHIALVLPPVLQAARFTTDFAGLVQNRHGALAAVLI